MSLDPFTEAAIDELKRRGLTHFIWIGGVAAGCWTALTSIAGWWLGQRSTLADLRQKGVETKLKSGDILDRIESSRVDLSSQRESFDLLLREFSDSLRLKRKLALKGIREEICRFHSCEYLDQLRRYIEDCRTFIGSADALDRILLDIIPALRTTLRFAEIINHEKILARLDGAAPYRFDPVANKVMLRRIRKTLAVFAIDARLQLWRIKRQFLKHLRTD